MTNQAISFPTDVALGRCVFNDNHLGTALALSQECRLLATSTPSFHCECKIDFTGLYGERLP